MPITPPPARDVPRPEPARDPSIRPPVDDPRDPPTPERDPEPDEPPLRDPPPRREDDDPDPVEIRDPPGQGLRDPADDDTTIFVMSCRTRVRGYPSAHREKPRPGPLLSSVPSRNALPNCIVYDTASP